MCIRDSSGDLRSSFFFGAGDETRLLSSLSADAPPPAPRRRVRPEPDAVAMRVFGTGRSPSVVAVAYAYAEVASRRDGALPMASVPRMSYSPEERYVLTWSHKLSNLLKTIAVGGLKGMYCCYAESGFVTWDLELALEVPPQSTTCSGSSRQLCPHVLYQTEALEFGYLKMEMIWPYQVNSTNLSNARILG